MREKRARQEWKKKIDIKYGVDQEHCCGFGAHSTANFKCQQWCCQWGECLNHKLYLILSNEWKIFSFTLI